MKLSAAGGYRPRLSRNFVAINWYGAQYSACSVPIEKQMHFDVAASFQELLLQLMRNRNIVFNIENVQHISRSPGLYETSLSAQSKFWLETTWTEFNMVLVLKCCNSSTMCLAACILLLFSCTFPITTFLLSSTSYPFLLSVHLTMSLAFC